MTQDTGRPRASSQVHLENALTRVTEWRFAPGEETGVHRHEYPYVIVPLSDGLLRLEHPDGTVKEAALEAGRSYYRDAAVRHNVVNAGEGRLAFVEVEFLAQEENNR